MIRFIAAIDDKRGLATATGIPWDIPADKQYFRQQTTKSWILMGFRTYQEFTQALPERRNLVATHDTIPLRLGFEPVYDAVSFIQENKDKTIWVIGGAALFAGLIQYADELYITEIEGDFKCTKFFPAYEKDFQVVSTSQPQQQNDLRFAFKIFKRRSMVSG